MKGDKSRNSGTAVRAVKAVAVGTVVGFVICMLILLLITFMLVKIQKFPETLVVPLAIFTACIGAFSGGYFSARVKKNNGLAMGAVCALVIFVLLLLISSVFAEDIFSAVSLLRMGAMLISGAIGGVLGVNKRRRRK
ncbi:MAG: TIGR04086 family membrane protein [Clostridia bacterium]|nr:TIGR04086 family membrane protein [Clostridia bacterium]